MRCVAPEDLRGGQCFKIEVPLHALSALAGFFVEGQKSFYQNGSLVVFVRNLVTRILSDYLCTVAVGRVIRQRLRI